MNDDLNKDLLAAAEADDLEKVKSLLDEGANINSRGEKGFTPLILNINLSWGASGDLSKYLISAGADVNSVADNGDTALQGAISNNDMGLADRLVEAGAIPGNAALSDLLRSAAMNGNLDMISKLLEIGAGIDGGDKNRFDTALLAAVSAGH